MKGLLLTTFFSIAVLTNVKAQSGLQGTALDTKAKNTANYTIPLLNNYSRSFRPLFNHPDNHINILLNVKEENNLTARIYSADGRLSKSLFIDKNMVPRIYNPDIDLSDLLMELYIPYVNNEYTRRNIPLHDF